MAAAPQLSETRRRLLQELLSGDATLHRRPGELVEPRPPGALAPLSAEQAHVRIHASMAIGQPLYNESITIHRRGPFSLEVLERSFNEVLRRHEMWRSSIEERDGRAWLVPHADLRLQLPLIDLAGLPEAAREEAARRLAADDARQPIDVTQAPLLRAKVVRLADDRHRLYLTLHHIIFDGVAIYRLLMPELTALYAAYERGEPSPLPEPRLQYADYALWRERQLGEPSVARELDYWRRKLAGELPELQLPTDRPPPATPTYRGSMETFELTPQLTASLKAVSAEEGVTLYVTLLAAFKAMLHRYSGQEDLVIGGVTDMRRRPELEGVIGYFLNSVALRTQPSGEMSFRDYLTQVQATVVEALDASNVPFDRVVREVRPRREGARHPLFQVLFSIEPPAPAFAEGWDLTQMDVTVGAAKFDLYLELDEHHDRLIGRFLYSADLFEPATIRRMIGHWLTLLRGVVADPGSALAELPLLTPEEREELVVRRNDTAADYPQVTLHALFEAQARATPEAIAVEGDGRAWTYRQLDQRADRLAQRLRTAGAAKGALVAIATERSPEMVAALLAILKTGAAYLPLDPGLPEARLAFLIEDARPAAILADAASLARLPTAAAPVVLCEILDAECGEPVRGTEAAAPDDLAYVLYTSGSTGRPKAVEVRHRSVVNLLEAVRREVGFNADDRLLAVTTLSFDIAALELFLPLVTGGGLVIASREDAADATRLGALIVTSGATAMQATPATWRGLTASGWRGDRRLKLLCGGEALPRDLATALVERGGGLWNMYGPTETTIWSLCHRVRPEDDPVPIGRPLANTRVHVLDRHGALLPDLAPGELFIAGEGLAQSYRNNPQLTAAKFVTLEGGERAYRTGDVVRYRSDGLIEFLGRTDNQVKIRGFRVGIEEVEATIGQYPGIAAAAVRAWSDSSGEQSLAAYIAGEALDQDAAVGLRKFVGERLPAYMVPTHVTLLTALPMTANGKIDRRQLPAPQVARPALGHAPRDDLERILADLWQEVLGLPDIGVDDNFFDLGGHSLLATILVAKIQATLGRELPLVTLFQSPTIAGLADMLRSARTPGFSHLVPLRTGGQGPPLFIVHGIFGHVLQLRDLAELLETTRPIYALQARGADLRQAPHATLDEMVEAYLAAVREVRPAGPYLLAGYSFGGLVAFEMARRLRERGEQIELLALLETDLCERFLPLKERLAYRLGFPLRVVGKLRSLPPGSAASYLRGKLAEVAQRVVSGGAITPPEGLTGPFADRAQQMYDIGVREFRRFRPGPYDGPISLFSIKAPRFDACDPIPIWRRAASAIELFGIDGRHDRIMERPFVASLAAQLSRRLARSNAASDGAPAPTSSPPKAALRPVGPQKAPPGSAAPLLGAGEIGQEWS